MLSKISSSKTGQFILFLFVIAIIVSFALTTDMSQSLTSANDVAVVGNQKISLREYRQAIEQTKNFYAQFMKGQPVPQSQLAMIEKQALDRLINQKLVGQLGDELELNPSKNQVTKTIKELPYFLTNKKFDLSKYKNLLRANGFTPQQFEQQISLDLKTKAAQQIISDIEVSKVYANEIDSIKTNGLKANGVIIEKSKLYELVPVTQDQITQYLANKDNKTKVENLYIKNNKRFSSAEKVRARHILIKTDDKITPEQALKKTESIRKNLNVKNFIEMANKYTQDPHGNKNGGSLGEFTRGRMVPPFEKVAFTQKPNTISAPVKTRFGYHLILVENKTPAKTTPLKEVESILAKELIQKTSDKDLNKLFSENFNQLKKQQTENKKLNSSALSKFDQVKEASIGLLKPQVNQMNLPKEEILKAYFSSKSPSFLHHSDGDTAFILKLEKVKAEKKDKQISIAPIQRELSQELIKFVKNKTKVSIN